MLRVKVMIAATLASWLAASVTQDAQTRLEPRALLDGRVEMLVPPAFGPMPEQMLKLKYPAERRPKVVLSNEAGSVSLALNHTTDRLPANELEKFHRYLEGLFRKLYPSAQWFHSEVIAVKGRQYIHLDLRTPAIDTDVRNLMLATSVDGRMLLISVNMTKELEGEWLDAGNLMIRSVVVTR
jgi:hypothetical protein